MFAERSSRSQEELLGSDRLPRQKADKYLRKPRFAQRKLNDRPQINAILAGPATLFALFKFPGRVSSVFQQSCQPSK
jgi:hypothetical protein